MPDTTRRTGEELPPEGARTASGTGTAPGVPSTSGTPGAHRDTFGTGEDAGRAPGRTASDRTASGTGAESPLVAAHPQSGGTPDGGTPNGGTAHHGTERMPGPGHDGADAPASRPRLLPHDDTDKLAAQLHHAVAGFVDAPRGAVEEADHILQELTARLTDAVSERRRTLRRSWQAADAADGGGAAATDTEQLRLALRDYRELAERLLRV
ncbi:hypothetical protein DKG34_01245 [Streptomyces sp. NWU49]|uniref:hypothetical protein n=1 Tax=Streptomyces sp. NWU49 TaxID=2201153 RepID=UPI000D672A16|nr:hypothetical protein [Streptomyces sp. NWU49]PWJ09255.1 hypothetical protein DKG34_01245 [Streptomyces sp. NWU49]